MIITKFRMGMVWRKTLASRRTSFRGGKWCRDDDGGEEYNRFDVLSPEQSSTKRQILGY